MDCGSCGDREPIILTLGLLRVVHYESLNFSSYNLARVNACINVNGCFGAKPETK